METIIIVAVVIAVVIARCSGNNVMEDAGYPAPPTADAVKAVKDAAAREWLQQYNTSMKEVAEALHSHSVVLDVLNKEVYFQRCGWDYMSLGECRDRVLTLHTKKEEEAAEAVSILDLIEEARRKALILKWEEKIKEYNTPWYKRGCFPEGRRRQLSEHLLSRLS